MGNPGLMSIPCIVFYILQLFIDATICNSWASKYERLTALEEQYAGELKEADEAHAAEMKQVGGGAVFWGSRKRMARRR